MHNSMSMMHATGHTQQFFGVAGHDGTQHAEALDALAITTAAAVIASTFFMLTLSFFPVSFSVQKPSLAFTPAHERPIAMVCQLLSCNYGAATVIPIPQCVRNRSKYPKINPIFSLLREFSQKQALFSTLTPIRAAGPASGRFSAVATPRLRQSCTSRRGLAHLGLPG